MKYTSARLIQIVCFSTTATILAATAHAQDPIDNAVAHVGVGAGINFYNPTDTDGRTSQGLALVYRWHSFHSGWGPTVGIDWHNTDFNETLGTVNAPLGSLRMRALLAGIGYTHRLGRWAASGGVSAGYSFNDFTVAGDAIPRFSSAGVPLTGVSVDNTWVVKPGATVWYDVFKHVGVGVAAAYLVTRPDQTITTAAGTQVQRLEADAVELTVGVTVGIWKKKS